MELRSVLVAFALGGCAGERASARVQDTALDPEDPNEIVESIVVPSPPDDSSCRHSAQAATDTPCMRGSSSGRGTGGGSNSSAGTSRARRLRRSEWRRCRMVGCGLH